MTAFSAFPLFYWALQQPAQTAIRWHKAENDALALPEISSQISWQQLGKLIANFSQNLPACSRIIGYCGSHKLLGLLCYCGVIAANKQILGLNPSLTESQREQILRDNLVDLFLNDEDVQRYLKPCEQQPLPAFNSTLPATLTLTSGSSGKPKAVVHSVQNHLENAKGVCELMNFGAQNAWLLSLPLFHVSGQGIVWRWLLQGAELVINEDKTTFAQALSQVSHASLVPTQLQRYLQNLPENRPLAQHILLGGAHIPAELIAQAQAHGMTTYSGYGMTEMASTICAAQNALGHVGEPLAGREVCIARSEIWVRGAGLGLGYWLNGEIVPLTNEQGWFATKDKGEWQGKNLRVTGRLDNMFISGGENIQPEEIEQVLFRSGLIKSVFVLPIDDAEFGQRPVALVDFVDGFSLQAVEKLQNFAKNTLERFKQPVAYRPLNPEKWQNGIKISRQQLKNQLSLLFCENNDEVH